jgi:hypothetical protein
VPVATHVAVDDAECVSGAERVGCLHQDAAGFLRWQALAALETRRERFTIHVCHDEVDEAVGAFADGVNRHDVRMRQPRRGFRLSQKPDADLFTERELGWQDLHRHFALEALVARVVDHAHATAADFPLECERGAKGRAQPLGQKIAHAPKKIVFARLVGSGAPLWRRFLERTCRKGRFSMAWTVHSTSQTSC